MGRRVQIETPDGETLTFDAWIAGSIAGDATVVDHPIEDGSSVSDHSQADPISFTLEVRQTENPIRDTETVGEERVLEAFEFLEEARQEGAPLTVTLPRVGVYENMVVASRPMEIDQRREGRFEVTLKQIEIATVTLVDVPIEAVEPSARAGQQEEEDLGRQSTEEEDEENIGDKIAGLFPGEDSESALNQIAGGL